MGRRRCYRHGGGGEVASRREVTIQVKGKIQDDLKAAMKSGDKLRMMALRSVLSEISRLEKDVRRDPNDAEILQIIKRERAKREESLEFARKAARQDLIDRTRRGQNPRLIFARYGLGRQRARGNRGGDCGGRCADGSSHESAARQVRRGARWQGCKRARQGSAREEVKTLYQMWNPTLGSTPPPAGVTPAPSIRIARRLPCPLKR